MAKQSDGPKGQPQFQSGAAPELGVDENLVADYAALVGNRKVLTTTERNALSGVTIWPGLEVLDTDLAAALLYLGGAWTVPTPAVRHVRRIFANTNTFTDATAFSVFPNATDKAAMDSTFVKAAGGSAVRVVMNGSARFQSGSQQNHFLGIRIAGTDYEVARRNFGTAVVREAWSDEVVITGIPAGTHTVLPVFKAAGASQVIFDPAIDFLTYTMQEVRAQ